MPALFTTTSIRPSFLMILSTASVTDFPLVTSTSSTSILACCASAFALSALRPFVSRIVAYTLCPNAAQLLAASQPKPLLVPVIKMEKKVILITGTSSGFGWLAANSCAALGHKVYATMRDTKGRNADKAETLAQQANIEILDVDITDSNSVNTAIATIIAKEGRLDVVVNNAGIYAVGIAETFTEEDVTNIMDVDVIGTWRVIRAALPQMRR